MFGDAADPVVTIASPTSTWYEHPEFLTLDSAATDDPSGVMRNLDGSPVTDVQLIDLHTLTLGNHTLAVAAEDWFGNEAFASPLLIAEAKC